MIDTVRGVLRVRKWPKKRGKPKSARQRFWIDWFRQANLLAKYADPMSQIRAKEMAAGSGMYPRDILLKAMRGRLYNWVDENGWRWYPVAAIGDISETLDVLAQTVGSVLVRATDRWRTPALGTSGQVLTNTGPDSPPIWAGIPGGPAAKSFTGLSGEAAASGAQATQGWLIDLATSLTVYGIEIIYDGGVGLTFQGHVLELNVKTVTAVVASTAVVNGFNALTIHLYLPFAAPVVLAGGTRYGFVCTRTDALATSNSRIHRTRSLEAPLPSSLGLSDLFHPTLFPTVADVMSNSGFVLYTVNLVCAL